MYSVSLARERAPTRHGAATRELREARGDVLKPVDKRKCGVRASGGERQVVRDLPDLLVCRFGAQDEVTQEVACKSSERRDRSVSPMGCARPCDTSRSEAMSVSSSSRRACSS